MKKIAVNRDYGGFSLSPKAVALLAKKKGKECYFFVKEKPCNVDEIGNKLSWSAYSVSNPDFKKMKTPDKNGLWKTANKYADSISIDTRPENRTDPDLIAVIEELGKEASGILAHIEIVEIPEEVTDWYIDEYDGLETIREGRSW
jgi:hypothetical protein